MVQATAQDGGEFRAEIADVAVVIPAYNHSRFLAEAIESVLAQTLPVRKIIVVDDASDDETSVIAARHKRVRLVRQPVNRGLSESRNLGMRLAGARWLLFLDADDRLLPHAVAHSVACMAKNPEAGFVYGAHRRVDAELRPISGKLYHPLAAEPFCEFLQDNVVGMIATALFDRAKLLEVGGFDPALPRCEDYDLFLRLARRWPVACHDQLIAEYRIHGRNMSADAAAMLQVALEVLERHRPPRAEREELSPGTAPMGFLLCPRSLAAAAWLAASPPHFGKAAHDDDCPRALRVRSSGTVGEARHARSIDRAAAAAAPAQIGHWQRRVSVIRRRTGRSGSSRPHPLAGAVGEAWE